LTAVDKKEEQVGSGKGGKCGQGEQLKGEVTNWWNEV
jgi:hypothetical protein